ncbi:MAG TPA: AAA family ATPase, partial [Phytomonospora sp.]
WSAETESPIGESGLPEDVDAAHPLAAVHCADVLDRVRREATRGERALAPLWMDFKLGHLDAAPAGRPDRLRDYWHPGTPGTRFVGRRDELATLTAALAPAERGGRVQVVGGVGGIGKTALAVAYAQEHGSRYRDGAIFYDFQSYAVGRAPDSADQALVKILPTIRDDLSSAGVEQLSAVGRMSAWQESTADRELLMVWDNVRSLAQIEPLLLWQRGCATILTTRHDIDVDGGDPLRLRSLERDAAHDLFTGIAGEDHDEDLVRRLLDADLDVPILIKAHAKQIRAGRRGLDEIVAELGEVEPVGRRRTQQAFFDRLDGSYLHLGPDQRYAFRFLGAHPGRFATAEVAAAVLGCEPDEAAELLEDLVDVGLAGRYRHETAEPRPPAYTAHDILRAYAAHQARAEGELAPIRDELSAYYRRRLAEDGGERRWLETELDNIGDTALSGRTGGHAALAASAGERFFAFGRFTDAAAVFERAAEVYVGEGDDARHAHALLGLGEVARLQGEWDRSLELCRRA